MADEVSIKRSPDLSFFTDLGLPPIPCSAFSIANGEVLESCSFGREIMRIRAVSDILSMSVMREPMHKNKNSGPDGTAHHGAQQGKAITGSENSQPRHPP
ncbi:hypothetical protein AVEN_135836-1 [Araneus ventricosus]|uniref:Uncharacterized protein n=1 Tax=Araneus ventricosus TaxID=182803 RepID=A0A4Y2IQ50_ARAVE|nr:hypothetical protein AVEN_135836-1 [Araneus ventricosus]